MSTKRPVDPYIAKFITVMSEEMQIYNELLLTLRQKQANIIEGKVEDLQESVNKEQLVLKEQERLEKNRTASMKKIQEIVGSDEEIKNLSQIIKLAESTYAERLSEIHLSLQKIIQEVILVNEENRYLLEYSLKFVRESARELVRASDQVTVYTTEGKGDAGSGSSALIEGKI